jgi:hypothetical protein
MPSVNCECGRILQVAEQYAGKQVLCPQCGRRLRVPGVPVEVAASAAATATASTAPPPKPAAPPPAARPAPAAPARKPATPPAKPARPAQAPARQAPLPTQPPPPPDPLADLSSPHLDMRPSRRRRMQDARQRSNPLVYIVVGILAVLFLVFIIIIMDKDRRESLFGIQPDVKMSDEGWLIRKSMSMASDPYGSGTYKKDSSFTWYYLSGDEPVHITAGERQLNCAVLVRHVQNKDGDDRIRVELYFTGGVNDLTRTVQGLQVSFAGQPTAYNINSQGEEFKSVAGSIDPTRTVIFVLSDSMLRRLTKAGAVEWKLADVNFSTPPALQRVLARLGE